MKALSNRHRGRGLEGLDDIPLPVSDPSAALALVSRCPRAGETPLVVAPELARAAGVREVFVKDERGRMGLGSFKALGAAHVIARQAEAGRARGQTYVTASAGNHGLSVAAGARAFGAAAQVFIAETVPETFADRLRAEGAEVIRAGATYEDSMAAAAAHAETGAGTLLSDSSWPGYTDVPRVLMEGYLVLMSEAVRQMRRAPSHVLVQAGVGGLAAAVAAHVRWAWGEGPRIVVVEPDRAPALMASIDAGEAVTASGGVSDMGRLDCKTPSLIALKGLGRDADDFVAITEAEGADGAARAAEAGLASTPSGAAGLSALLAARGDLDLGPEARVLTFLTERP